jgi:glycosyltransferase involved in cell wall biosynthesis
MRVLIDLTCLLGETGGVVTYAAGLLAGWRQISATDVAAEEDEVIAAVGDGLPDVVRRQLDGFAEVVALPLRGSAPRVIVPQTAIPALAARRRADVILGITPVVPLLSSVPSVGVVHDLRYVSNPREFGTMQRLYRESVYHAGYHRATRLVAVSEATRAALARSCNVGAAKARVIHHGADHVDAWPAAERGSHGIAFAHYRNKQPDLAVQAWAILRERHPDVGRLEVVGAPAALRASLQGRVRDAGLDGLISIHPYLPDDEFRRLFCSAAVVVLPSTLEGFGMPVVEAMRVGIPVVAADDPALREAGGDAAIYAQATSAESFAAACERVLFDGEGTDRATAGLERSDSFKWRRTAAQTRDLLLDAVAVTSARSGKRP